MNASNDVDDGGEVERDGVRFQGLVSDLGGAAMDISHIFHLQELHSQYICLQIARTSSAWARVGVILIISP